MTSVASPDGADLRGLRVLLACEAYYDRASGGLVPMRLAEVLTREGAQVHVFVPAPAVRQAALPDVGVTAYARGGRLGSALHHLKAGPVVSQFRACLAAFRPRVVHLASFNFSSSRFLVEEALAAGSGVVLQPWTHHFHCDQGYGFREGRVCLDCAGGRFDRGVRRGCGTPGTRTLHAVSRVALRRAALKAPVVYSTCATMDAVLQAYGFGASRLVRGPLPFDPRRLDGLKAHDGEELVFYGQPLAIKGFHLLRRLVDGTPGARWGIFPSGASAAQREAAGLAEDLGPGVLCDPDQRWNGGLAERVAGARAVVLPTGWPTPIEYAVLEAMGLGKPIVTFGVGAHRDLLVDGDNALVAPAGDVEALLERLRRVQDDAALRAHLARRARETFEQVTADGPLRSALAEAYNRALGASAVARAAP